MRLKLFYISSILATTLLVAGCQGAATSEAPATAPGVASDAPPTKPLEEFRELTLPAGTTFTVTLDDSVGSATSGVDDPVRAHVTRPVSVGGVVAVPVGSNVSGAVVEAVRSGRVKGRAHVGIRFDKLRMDAETYAIHTAEITRTAPGEKKKDAMKIGGAAAAGAVVGGLLGGGKGAAIGAGVGGGGGAAYVMSERGQEVSVGRGATLTVRVTEPIKLRVRATAAN